MSDIVVGDADILISLIHKVDLNHQKAKKVSSKLDNLGKTVIFPNTAILEAVTALKRSLNQPQKAHLLNRQYQQGLFQVEYITEKIQQRASEIFEQKAVSKKNTIFDAIIAATAEALGAETIFSFDNWYPKLGFKLAGEKV